MKVRGFSVCGILSMFTTERSNLMTVSQKKLNTFLVRAQEKWGDRWSYEEVEYQNNYTPVTIICKVHGPFQQAPKNHLRGSIGCDDCKGLTPMQFLARSRSVWGDRWDYSKSKYVNMETRLTIICREHGEFSQTPSNHFAGKVGCPRCYTQRTPEKFIEEVREVWGDRWGTEKTEYMGVHEYVILTCSLHGDFQQRAKLTLLGSVGCDGCKTRSHTTKKFVESAKKIWEDRWDYSRTKYVHSESKVIIHCPEHGAFEQTPSQHLMKKVGCKSCVYRSKTLTDEEFILRANKVWGGRWDYSDTSVSSGYKSHVTITCPDHGPFEQSVAGHLAKMMGCRECFSPTNKMDRESFVQKSQSIWDDRWDYSNVNLVDRDTPVTITCTQHGSFTQAPKYHLLGRIGCIDCIRALKADTIESFMMKAESIWGYRWDYSGTKYTSSREYHTFTCREHGSFQQSARGHLEGNVGCSGCYTQPVSGRETDMADFIESLGLPTLRNQRGLLKGSRQEIDIYVPDLKIGFEFNGLYWHSEEFKSPSYHYEKYLLAQKSDITLYQIWEDDWVYRRGVVKSHIRTVLGMSDRPKVFARKTKVEELSTHEARPFMDSYHIQGFVGASYHLGLKADDEVVAVASFKRRGGDYELVRYATSAQVVGGHSKLISYFEKNFSYSKLITFADLTFGSGNLYAATGWVEDYRIDPDYSYVVGDRREHKFNYRIARFRDDPTLLFEEGLTERELATMNMLLRIYDAGKIRFSKSRPVDTYR